MSPLAEVRALLLDVFGTVLAAVGKKHGIDWDAFAWTWRRGYLINTPKIAKGGTGSLNVDIMHREHFGVEVLTSDAKADLNLAWHHAFWDQGWPDTIDGLYALKKQMIISTVSNSANIRLLVDMVKYADLPWDTVFASELFGSFKPISLLSLEPQNCVMVAAHIYEFRAAASVVMRTSYIRRAGEEPPDVGEVKSKAEGGDVDVVVDSFIDLAQLLAKGN
ncbi:HAD-like domain-containing protein [Mycena crocata]|nr:HAD-like domain-containing protein [Mycena crocata]